MARTRSYIIASKIPARCALYIHIVTVDLDGTHSHALHEQLLTDFFFVRAAVLRWGQWELTRHEHTQTESDAQTYTWRRRHWATLASWAAPLEQELQCRQKLAAVGNSQGIFSSSLSKLAIHSCGLTVPTPDGSCHAGTLVATLISSAVCQFLQFHCIRMVSISLWILLVSVDPSRYIVSYSQPYMSLQRSLKQFSYGSLVP